MASDSRVRLSEPFQKVVSGIFPSIRNELDSVVSIAVINSLNAESDETLWSWRHLKTQFREQESEVLFKKYINRIHNSVFVVFLLWCFASSAVQIGSSTIFGLKPSYTTLYIPVVGATCSFCLLILSYNEKTFTYFRFLPTIASYLMCFILILQEYISFVIDCFYQEDCLAHLGQPRLGSCFTLTLLIYYMPPFRSKKECVIMGCLIFLSECLVSFWVLKVPIEKLGSEFAFYILLNGVGVVKLLLVEIMQRRSFLDQRSWVETTLNVTFQKEQEEKLMLSIIPKYISVSLKPVIRQAIENMKEANPLQNVETYKAFHDLYVQRQNNVSILFADIVNFTPLTETMEVDKLVEMLNELFGRFDEAAEKNSCLRIKIIGDCYYCVCGIPKPLLNHAQNCVNLGFEMINIICDIREERELNIDMRIGINSGDILCGLIGMKKWQYDVWSRDVTIANLMEQSGKKGRVHISRATRDLLEDEFRFENGHGASRNATVKEWNIETFFVVNPNKVTENERIASSPKNKKHRRVSFAAVPNIIQSRKRSSDLPLHIRRKTLLDQSLLNYRKMVSRINLHMEDTINKMALSKKEQWLRSTDINPFLLTFKNWRLESLYLKQRDPLFKYNLPWAALIFATVIIVCSIEFASLWTSNILIIVGCGILVFYLCAGYVSWHNFIYKELYKGDVLDSVPSYELKGLRKLLNLLCNSIHKKVWIRLFIWLTFSSLSLAWTFLAGWYAINCFETNTCSTNNASHIGTNSSDSLLEDEPNFQPRLLTYSFALLMVVFSSFMRINFYLKFIINICTLSTFVFLIKFHLENYCFNWSSYFIRALNACNSSDDEHIIFLILIFLLLHLGSRQIEYLSRVSYLWKDNLKAEQEETVVIDLVNKTLLLNILPFHVAHLYFSNSMPADKLYHEKYKEAAVMFASISNFMDFYTENEFNLNGKTCLQTLNEIIVKFDEILSEIQFSRIEKMKVVGSTYMAAAGLRAGIRASRVKEQEETVSLDAGTNLEMLVNFAIHMMKELVIINKDAFQDFQLRIGIDSGQVIAGVVGATKPFYDIWGDTVNVASRMDSTGKMGRIQVTEKTAMILMEKGFKCESRGEIYVKGKGLLQTYFVITPYDSEEITQL